MNFYNENDPFAADWLENLIAAELIPAGKVDRRSIKEVQPDDLQGFTQCHFFCGIGGWSEALRLAGWTGPCWTGSCPCQPFSQAAGKKRKGKGDERHLWPELYRLIRECGPSVVYGEQVASADGLEWLDGVCTDLESSHYAVAALDLCSAGKKAPNIRQRLYWVADSRSSPPRHDGARKSAQASAGEAREPDNGFASEPGRCGSDSRLANTECDRLRASGRAAASVPDESDYWALFELTYCGDGEVRRFKPGTFPLAPRVPRELGQGKSELASLARNATANRAGRLRGYGNAINPYVAAEFIRAFMESQ